MCGAVDRLSGTGREVYLDDLVIVCLLNQLHQGKRVFLLPEVIHVFSIVVVFIVLLHSHYTCLSLTSSATVLTKTAKSHFKHKLYH